MSQSVLITGIGGLTAVGMDIESSWQAIKAGQSGIAPITQWDSTEWQFNLAAQLAEYNPRQLIKDRKLLKLISKQDVFGINAANQAVDGSGLIEYRDSLPDASEFNDRTGIYVGSPGNKFQQTYDFLPLMAKSKNDMQVFAEQLFSEVHPMWLLKILPNNVLAYVGIEYQFKGPNQNITNHAVSGMQAMIEAMAAIKQGIIDRAIVVAYDIGFDAQSYLYYGQVGTLSQQGLKSFDKEADGTVLGEGAGAIILESEQSAKARQATVYGQVLSGCAVSEAQGIFALDKQGEGLARSVQASLDQAKLTASDIGMITAHANGNPASDHSEAHTIRQLFNQQTPVTGFKWSVGHTLAAGGVLDTIFTLRALQEKHIPGIHSLKQVADQCQGINVSANAGSPSSASALVMARGFGSMQASIVIQAAE